MSGFSYVVAIHEEVFPLLDHKGVDLTDGGTASRLVDDIAQVAG